jgi:hypothetical protein
MVKWAIGNVAFRRERCGRFFKLAIKNPVKTGFRVMAESEGFEPPEGYPSTVFKTAAFDHSASSPKSCI